MKGVPHLIELNNKFRERGFEIVAVSDEDAGTIEKFVKDKSINYGIIKASNVIKTYGGKGYPSAWVLDVDGKVIWKGHPANLTDAMVEDWVKDLAPAKITKEVSKALRNAVEAYNKGEFGKAETEVDKHLGSDDPAVKADAEFVDGVIEKRRAVGEAKAAKARESGDLPKLATLLEAEAKAFDGSEHGKKCAEEAKTVKASKEYKDCLKAQSELDKLKPKINDMKADKAKRALEKIAKDFPGTPAGKEAAELAKDF
ncbi:hypothetical protein EDM80_07185 [bacterium]|nr:MAG: hypothetical protein EDM80_07185 [bacterium]RIK65401.1 MAG: hypothetical protein DCC64_01830 [Planctomycetota bacterium]